ncbi:MAG: hypothetical protein FWD71_14745, partial [Oscillospiraceae bacterium]|nr:hypothetical protein [Oscillospiraceae bacterium]
KELPESAVPATLKIEKNILTFTPETTETDVDIICRHLPPDKAFEVKNKFADFRRINEAPSPAKNGLKFSVPKLFVTLQGEFVLAEPDIIFEEFDWDIAKLVSPKMEPHEFNIEPQGAGFVIELDGNKLSFSLSGEQLTMPQIDVENWTTTNLVSWLDRTLRQDDIPQPIMVEWLRQAVEYLTDTRGLKLSAIMIAKYALANKIEGKIKAARSKAREQAFQAALFERGGRVMLDFDNGFEFSESMYDGELMYNGRYKFQKHYLGSQKVPILDGGENGEEFSCAKAIDALPQVKYWLRNAARHRNSFWLPTSTDKFYPDFVAELEGGCILVVEYKGALTAQMQDTKEKRLIGELWEKQSSGRGLFMIAEKSKDGLNVSEQIKKKIGSL